MKKTNQLLTIFFSFLKIGLFTFGGGYAMIALIEKEFVEKKKWIEKKEFLDVIAIAESTPGPLAINSATYIGYKVKGFLGALLATIAVSIPSFVIIYIISLFLNKFLAIEYVGYAFRGIQVCVIYLILSAGIKMLKELEKTFINILVFILTIICMITFSLLAIDFSSIYYIFIGGFIGLSVYLISFYNKKKKEKIEEWFIWNYF